MQIAALVVLPLFLAVASWLVACKVLVMVVYVAWSATAIVAHVLVLVFYYRRHLRFFAQEAPRQQLLVSLLYTKHALHVLCNTCTVGFAMDHQHQNPCIHHQQCSRLMGVQAAVLRSPWIACYGSHLNSAPGCS